jgi:hypothetical protein
MLSSTTLGLLRDYVDRERDHFGMFVGEEEGLSDRSAHDRVNEILDELAEAIESGEEGEAPIPNHDFLQMETPEQKESLDLIHAFLYDHRERFVGWTMQSEGLDAEEAETAVTDAMRVLEASNGEGAFL